MGPHSSQPSPSAQVLTTSCKQRGSRGPTQALVCSARVPAGAQGGGAAVRSCGKGELEAPRAWEAPTRGGEGRGASRTASEGPSPQTGETESEAGPVRRLDSLQVESPPRCPCPPPSPRPPGLGLGLSQLLALLPFLKKPSLASSPPLLPAPASLLGSLTAGHGGQGESSARAGDPPPPGLGRRRRPKPAQSAAAPPPPRPFPPPLAL